MSVQLRWGAISRARALGPLRARSGAVVAWTPPDVTPITSNPRIAMLAVRTPYRRILPAPDGVILPAERALAAGRVWRVST